MADAAEAEAEAEAESKAEDEEESKAEEDSGIAYDRVVMLRCRPEPGAEGGVPMKFFGTQVYVPTPQASPQPSRTSPKIPRSNPDGKPSKQSKASKKEKAAAAKDASSASATPVIPPASPALPPPWRSKASPALSKTSPFVGDSESSPEKANDAEEEEGRGEDEGSPEAVPEASTQPFGSIVDDPTERVPAGEAWWSMQDSPSMVELTAERMSEMNTRIGAALQSVSTFEDRLSRLEGPISNGAAPAAAESVAPTSAFVPDCVCQSFLADACTKGAGCSLRHPSPGEKERLRRQCAATPCQYGLDCTIQNCLYSHPCGEDLDLEMEAVAEGNPFPTVISAPAASAGTSARKGEQRPRGGKTERAFEFPKAQGKGAKGYDKGGYSAGGYAGGSYGYAGGKKGKKGDWADAYGGGKGYNSQPEQQSSYQHGEVVLNASPPPPPQALVGMWRDSLGNAIQVNLSPEGALSAWLSREEGPKELGIWLDQWGELQCGNGTLHQASYACRWPVPPGMAPNHLFWHTKNWLKISIWERLGPPPQAANASHQAASRKATRPEQKPRHVPPRHLPGATADDVVFAAVGAVQPEAWPLPGEELGKPTGGKAKGSAEVAAKARKWGAKAVLTPEQKCVIPPVLPSVLP